MKKIKILVLIIITSIIGYSCKKNNDFENKNNYHCIITQTTTYTSTNQINSSNIHIHQYMNETEKNKLQADCTKVININTGIINQTCSCEKE